MFSSNYFPYSAPSYTYGGPTYGTPSYGFGRPESEYLRAIAEEDAARRQYTDALRAQEEARSRAARARLARQAYESSHNSYISDEEEDDGPFAGYGYPARRLPTYGYPSPAALERQRLAALDRERERERERIRALEEERERRRRLLEEERRRRMLLEEEERRLQSEAEEQERRRLEQELLRRRASASNGLSPLEQLLGLRPAYATQPFGETVCVLRHRIPDRSADESLYQPISRRARTVSPAHRGRQTPAAPTPTSNPVQRSASRSPAGEHIPINNCVHPSPPAAPSTSVPINQPRSSPSPQPRPSQPQPPSAQEVEAATKIQTTWRTPHAQRTALQRIAEQGEKFEQLTAGFVLPSSLDYSVSGNTHEHVSVPTDGVSFDEAMDDSEAEKDVPKLAYTPTNAPLHAYYEELSRILTKLDGVQSGGHEEVRTKRRELARRVEREAERIEKLRGLVWRAWSKKQVEAQEQKKMEVDEEVPVTSPTAAEETTEFAPAPEPTEGVVEEPLEATMVVESVPEPIVTEATLPSAPHEAELEDLTTHAEDFAAEPTNDPSHLEITAPDASPELPSSETNVPPLDSSEAYTSDTSVDEHQMAVDSSESLPALVVDHHSDTDGDLEPTPPTPSAPSQTLVSEPQSKLDMLRPLVSQEWEEELDFF